MDNLYQEMILEHHKHPRHFGAVEGANACAHGLNPLCGDDFHLFLTLDDTGTIREIGFTGSGCAISTASASLLTATVKEKNQKEALELARDFHALVTDDAVSTVVRERLGKLRIFEGVKKFPVRVKCAMLIWRTLEEALARKKNNAAQETFVSTETT